MFHNTTCNQINDQTMNKQEQHVSEYMVQTCINSSLKDLSRLASNSVKGYLSLVFQLQSYRRCMCVVKCGCLSASSSAFYPLQYLHIHTSAFYLRPYKVTKVVVVLSSVDVGDPRCPINGDDLIFFYTYNLNQALSVLSLSLGFF